MERRIFKVNKERTIYKLLGYKITRTGTGKDYAQVVLAREMFVKADSEDIACGESADTYYLPVEIVEQFEPYMIGEECYAIINTTTKDKKTYRNILEIEFVD